MKTSFAFRCGFLTIVAASTWFLRGEAPPAVPYPAGYRSWVHVKTVLIGPQSAGFATTGGFHHVYANPEAMAGYASGRFPDGAVLVFDLLEGIEGKGNTAEGPRKKLEIMVKDSRRFADTGGWGYERFKGDTRDAVLTAADKAQCFGCHQTKKEKDFVFSEWKG